MVKTGAHAQVLSQISVTLSAALNVTLPKACCTCSHILRKLFCSLSQNKIYIPTYSSSPVCCLCSDTTPSQHGALAALSIVIMSNM